MDFLIIHGSYGSKNGNWFPWLKEKLEELGHKVHLPQFPVGEDEQRLNSWMQKIEKLDIPFGENLVMVAHSIGPAFALSLLEEHRAGACFFVSGLSSFVEVNEKYDKVNESFVDKNFEWNTIKSNCQEFHLYHSDDDPYVPLKYAKELADKLDADLEIIPGGGHLNEGSGYTTFPKLLDDIKEFLSQRRPE